MSDTITQFNFLIKLTVSDEPLKVQLNRGYELFDDLVKALNIRNESVFGPQHRDEKGNLIPKHIQITSVVQVDICEGEQASEVYSYPAGTTWTGWVYPGYAYNYNLDTSSEVLDSYCLFFQARVGDFNVNFDTIEGKVIFIRQLRLSKLLYSDSTVPRPSSH